jgi:hypothetical protein
MSVKNKGESRSKIGRLAFRDRMAFNRMVRDGYTSTVLIDYLAQHGVQNVNPTNITDYRKSPAYTKWLNEQKQIERDRVATEQAMRLADSLGGSASEKIKSILASKLFSIMPGVNEPEEIASLISAIRTVTDAERLELRKRMADQKDEQLALEREKFRWQLAENMLKFAKDIRIQEIAGQTDATQEDKIRSILTYMDQVEAEAASE